MCYLRGFQNTVMELGCFFCWVDCQYLERERLSANVPTVPADETSFSKTLVQNTILTGCIGYWFINCLLIYLLTPIYLTTLIMSKLRLIIFTKCAKLR